MGPEYVIEVWPYGVLVKAAPGQHGIPMDALARASKLVGKAGKFHPGLAAKYKAVFALVRNVRDLDKWIAEIDRENRGLPPMAAWLNGVDRGRSSNTIAHVLWPLTDALGGEAPGVPHDPGDFGRCVRLLDAVPELRTRLPQLGRTLPEWAPFVNAWAELEALYREEAPTGTCPRLFARLHALGGRS